MVRQWNWLVCVPPSCAGLQTSVIVGSFRSLESSGLVKVCMAAVLFLSSYRKKKLWTSDTHMQLADRGAGNLPSNPGLSAAVTRVESLVQEGLCTLYYLR